MKYVVSWTFRSFGSVAEQEASATRLLLKVYSKWTPPASMTFHQFLGRIDGSGGYQVVETAAQRLSSKPQPSSLPSPIFRLNLSWTSLTQ